jgi:hypothetical protein
MDVVLVSGPRSALVVFGGVLLPVFEQQGLQVPVKKPYYDGLGFVAPPWERVGHFDHVKAARDSRDGLLCCCSLQNGQENRVVDLFDYGRGVTFLVGLKRQIVDSDVEGPPVLF